MRGKKSRFSVRDLTIRFFKGLLKAGIAYVSFMVLSAFAAPFESFFGHQTLSSVLIVLYVSFIFIVELVHGTILQHVFSIANSLMVVLYFGTVLNDSLINLALEQTVITVDLSFFFGVFVLGGVLGFAKSMLHLLKWMNEREELWLEIQMRSHIRSL